MNPKAGIMDACNSSMELAAKETIVCPDVDPKIVRNDPAGI